MCVCVYDCMCVKGTKFYIMIANTTNTWSLVIMPMLIYYVATCIVCDFIPILLYYGTYTMSCSIIKIVLR